MPCDVNSSLVYGFLLMFEQLSIVLILTHEKGEEYVGPLIFWTFTWSYIYHIKITKLTFFLIFNSFSKQLFLFYLFLISFGH